MQQNIGVYINVYISDVCNPPYPTSLFVKCARKVETGQKSARQKSRQNVALEVVGIIHK